MIRQVNISEYNGVRSIFTGVTGYRKALTHLDNMWGELMSLRAYRAINEPLVAMYRSANPKLLKRSQELEAQLKEHAEVCKESADPLTEFDRKFSTMCAEMSSRISQLGADANNHCKRNSEDIANLKASVEELEKFTYKSEGLQSAEKASIELPNGSFRYAEGDAFQTHLQYGTECFGVIKGIVITHGGDKVVTDWYSPHDQTKEPVKRDSTREPVSQFNNRFINGEYRLYDRTAAYNKRQEAKRKAIKAKIKCGAVFISKMSRQDRWIITNVNAVNVLYIRIGDGHNSSCPFNDVVDFIMKGVWSIEE